MFTDSFDYFSSLYFRTTGSFFGCFSLREIMHIAQINHACYQTTRHYFKSLSSWSFCERLLSITSHKTALIYQKKFQPEKPLSPEILFEEFRARPSIALLYMLGLCQPTDPQIKQLQIPENLEKKSLDFLKKISHENFLSLEGFFKKVTFTSELIKKEILSYQYYFPYNFFYPVFDNDLEQIQLFEPAFKILYSKYRIKNKLIDSLVPGNHESIYDLVVIHLCLQAQKIQSLAEQEGIYCLKELPFIYQLQFMKILHTKNGIELKANLEELEIYDKNPNHFVFNQLIKLRQLLQECKFEEYIDPALITEELVNFCHISSLAEFRSRFFEEDSELSLIYESLSKLIATADNAALKLLSENLKQSFTNKILLSLISENCPVNGELNALLIRECLKKTDKYLAFPNKNLEGFFQAIALDVFDGGETIIKKIKKFEKNR